MNQSQKIEKKREYNSSEVRWISSQSSFVAGFASLLTNTITPKIKGS